MGQADDNRRLFLLIACSVLLLPTACSRSDPERELRETIARMARAIEARQRDDFLKGLSEDFTRESGAFDKHEARRLLAGLMSRNERLALAVIVTEVDISGDRARVRLQVVATGSSGGLLPERGQAWTFDSAWRRESGAWKVFNADWRETL